MIVSTVDHVAIAVPHRAPAIQRYLNDFGGGSVAFGRRAGITIDQVSFSRGTKLEIVGPDSESPEGDRSYAFLRKYGSVVHHVTLLVESVENALAKLKAAGVRPVGVHLSDPRYQEAYVLPEQGGGVMVQLTRKDVDDEGWARRYGHTPTAPKPNCPDFIGARWSQPILDDIANQWRLLGGNVVMSERALTVSWGPDRLRFEYVEGESRAVEELLFEGSPTLSSSVEAGPAIASARRE